MNSLLLTAPVLSLSGTILGLEPHAFFYYAATLVLSVLVLVGISRMSKVERAVGGNLLGSFSMLAAVVLTLWYNGIFSVVQLWVGLLIGAAIGVWLSIRVRMIEMPQMVGLLNGFGGAASMIVGLLTLVLEPDADAFSLASAALAVFVGGMTFSGSVVAAAKLAKWMRQKPIVLPGHPILSFLCLLLSLIMIICAAIPGLLQPVALAAVLLLLSLASLLFGILLAIRVGGADMPITISLLNSFSGVAGAIAGLAIADLLLVAVGGIVGASGLLLTQIMCRAMNRHLSDILLGKTSVVTMAKPRPEELPATEEAQPKPETPAVAEEATSSDDSQIMDEAPLTAEPDADPLLHAASVLHEAQRVILVPGYGMALSQAQQEVKRLLDMLEAAGKRVDFAIHPVAGRMPGHMNVLLAEVDVPYEKLLEMDDANPLFAETDCAVIIGANDVINPAANTAEGTPIYGMPVLAVDRAEHILILNFDKKPGYAGVENPLYSDTSGRVELLLGDAKEKLSELLEALSHAGEESAETAETVRTEAGAGEPAPAEEASPVSKAGELLNAAHSVILVPGYGMALAQAQREVKQLLDKLESEGKQVRFAIHPVAGRMPGHMNVLLAEVDVPYEQLCEMEEINPEFAHTDCVVIIGANDVVNPAANTAEGTPIYGMPVLSVSEAAHVVILNYDTKPGYAGVENPLYEDQSGRVVLLLGDAKEELTALLKVL